MGFVPLIGGTGGIGGGEKGDWEGEKKGKKGEF